MNNFMKNFKQCPCCKPPNNKIKFIEIYLYIYYIQLYKITIFTNIERAFKFFFFFKELIIAIKKIYSHRITIKTDTEATENTSG